MHWFYYRPNSFLSTDDNYQKKVPFHSTVSGPTNQGPENLRPIILIIQGWVRCLRFRPSVIRWVLRPIGTSQLKGPSWVLGIFFTHNYTRSNQKGPSMVTVQTICFCIYHHDTIHFFQYSLNELGLFPASCIRQCYLRGQSNLRYHDIQSLGFLPFCC